MNYETFIKRIEPRLTKAGSIHCHDVVAISMIKYLAQSSSNTWHYHHWSRNGYRYSLVGDNHFERFRQFCRLLGLIYYVGNDAPHSGAEGDYVYFPESSRRKLRPALLEISNLIK